MHVHIYYDFIVSAALNLKFSEDKIFFTCLNKPVKINPPFIEKMHVYINYVFIVHAALILEFSQNKFFLHMPKQTQQNFQS